MTAVVERRSVTALGVRIDRLDADTALDRVDDLLRRPGCAHVAFVNAHSMNLAVTDTAYRAALSRADLVLNDGVGMALLARSLGTPFPANLNGTDFVPRVVDRLARDGETVFLFGGRPGVAERAAEQLIRTHRGLRIVGCLDGYGLVGADAAEVVRRSGATAVLVALGNPRQELWVDAFAERSGVSLAVSVGAYLDFAAGAARRAPLPVRKLRLEWAFRLAAEPRRLARRYVVGIPVFLARVGRAQVEAAATAVPSPSFSALYEYPPVVPAGRW